jgi:hypothetical protein
MIFSPRVLDTLQNRQSKEHDCAHGDPMRGDMQYHGGVDQTADHYQETDHVNPE